MPLPPNSSITLQGHSAATNKPKVAMIMRMTEETLDVLGNLAATDRMDFEFGDKPAIHVNGQSFPMRFDKEKDNQELFIRMTMAARPGNPPLKLNANVIGKFVLERNLTDKLVKQIHNANAEALKQKNERKTIMVDSPPIMSQPTTAKATTKKKAATRVAKVAPVIMKNYVTTTPSQPPKEPVPSTSSISSEMATHFLQRLIHYLAINPATQADVVKNVGGVEAERDARLKIVEILNDVAEVEQLSRRAATASPVTKWKLKPETWLEVRPYQYSGYTDNVRTAVARQARTWLSSLKIPETNEAWEHVRFRSSGSANAASAPTPRATNGALSATAKARAGKAKETKAKNLEVMAKSEVGMGERERSRGPAERLQPPVEGRPPSTRPEKGKQRESEKEEGELSASETPPNMTPAVSRRSITPVRRPTPISVGQRLEPPAARHSGASTPTMPPPPSPRPAMPPPKPKGPVDARSSKRPPPEQSERGYAIPPILPPANDRKPTVLVKKEAVPIKAERPAAVGHRASSSTTLSAKERDAVRRDREETKRERSESDRESIRALKRERASDRESVDGRERVREREKIRGSEARRRDRDAEPSRPVKEREVARERPEPVRERPLAATTKTSKKRKVPEPEDSGDESSDWGYEDRMHPRKVAPKPKKERESPPPPTRPSSSLKASRRDASPPRKVKRESPMPGKSSVASSMKSSAANASTLKASSNAAPSRPLKRELKDDGDRAPSVKPTKRRRTSPIYTSSSEDEKVEVRPKKVKSDAKAAHSTSASNTADVARPRANRPLPPSTSASTSASSSSAVTPASTTSKPPAAAKPAKSVKPRTDRQEYKALYPEYLSLTQKLVSQKAKLEKAVEREEGTDASGDDDEYDSDILPIDELQRLRTRYHELHLRLENILNSKIAAGAAKA